MLPCVRTTEGLQVFCNGQSYLMRRDDLRFKKLVDMVNKDDEKGVIELVTAQNVVAQVADGITHGNVTYKGGVLYRNGVALPKDELHNLFVTRLETFLKDGLSTKSLLAFLNNFLDNPSFNSRQQGLQFIERNNLPITEDGHFLAYKSVRSDYKDKHSGKFSNRPGQVLEMPRVTVDDNPNNHCSNGFHVGALEYSGPNGWFHNSGDQCVIVKVNPRDMVSVPGDHECRKCRVCRYEVLGDYNSQLTKPIYTSQGNYDSSMYDGEDVEYFEDVTVGDELVFSYTDANQVTKTRHAFVESINDYNETLTCTLHEDEEDAGQIRTFRWERMNNVKAL